MVCESSATFERRWILTGAISGIIGSLLFPLLIAVDMPRLPTIILGGSFGILISVSGIGLYRLVRLHRKTVSAQDFYLGAATMLFAWNMLGHPRFGRVFAMSGLLIGFMLLAINLYAFPFTPEEVGISYFYAPLTGLWYLVVYIQALRSLGWAEQAAQVNATGA